MKEKRDEKENPKKRKERKMNRLLAVNYQIPLKKSDRIKMKAYRLPKLPILKDKFSFSIRNQR